MSIKKQDGTLWSFSYLQLEMCTHVYSTVTLPGTPVLFYPKPGIYLGNLTLELGIGWISIAVQITNVDDTMSSY